MISTVLRNGEDDDDDDNTLTKDKMIQGGHIYKFNAIDTKLHCGYVRFEQLK